jgi:sulfite reductase beta subunit-like hemoprotein
VSRRDGNGVVELTRRANLQLRGLRADTLGAAQAELVEAGLLAPDPATDERRNVLAAPAAGLDPTEIADIRPITSHLLALLTGATDAPPAPLPPPPGVPAAGAGGGQPAPHRPPTGMPADGAGGGRHAPGETLRATPGLPADGAGGGVDAPPAPLHPTPGLPGGGAGGGPAPHHPAAGVLADGGEAARAVPLHPKAGVLVDGGGAVSVRGIRHDVCLGAVRRRDDGHVVAEVTLGAALPTGSEPRAAHVVPLRRAAEAAIAALAVAKGERVHDLVEADGLDQTIARVEAHAGVRFERVAVGELVRAQPQVGTPIGVHDT